MQFFFRKSQKLSNKTTSTLAMVFICIFTLISSISYPKTAHAGLFSFFSSLTGDTVSAKAPESEHVANSQNMLVLQASVNTDPNNKSSGDALLMSGDALVADITPSGTASSEEEDNNTQISLYVVREGDSLARIAKMFGVTVNTIIWANNLDRNPVLQKDQKLIILPISGLKYTVKSGDTIKGIVTKYKSDLNEVLKFNDLSLSSVLQPGDTIIIPDAEPTIITTPKIAAGKTGVNPVHDANGPYYPGYYMRPIDAGHKSQGLHGYNGVDLADSVGTPIHAAASGIVIRSSVGGWNGGYGNYVIISHDNGTQTLYAHTQRNYVSVGDRVEQGQMIARIGMTGKTTGPHVHFEIRGAKNPF